MKLEVKIPTTVRMLIDRRKKAAGQEVTGDKNTAENFAEYITCSDPIMMTIYVNTPGYGKKIQEHLDACEKRGVKEAWHRDQGKKWGAESILQEAAFDDLNKEITKVFGPAPARAMYYAWQMSRVFSIAREDWVKKNPNSYDTDNFLFDYLAPMVTCAVGIAPTNCVLFDGKLEEWFGEGVFQGMPALRGLEGKLAKQGA